MRQIKFRAWDKESKRMYDWTTIKQYPMYYTFDSDIVIPMQYTGLKDKNGTEIYEGDIIKCTDGADEINELNSDTGIGKVEWFTKWGFWNISNIENGLGDILHNGYVEVIGNIWENPELLK